MVILGVLLLVGITLTIRWGATPYRPWEPEPDSDANPSPRVAALRYLRGVAVALVGGFWAGALVTGPAVRLIMRLLAATAGDGAQGAITEAEEVVGEISVDGTIGLYLFGGVLPGMLSGAIYVACRRWLPSGRLGGLAFGVLHLVVAATRIDPLRPGNADFDIVGPGWLAALTFGLAAIVHGMAVVAIANRFSNRFPTADALADAPADAPADVPRRLRVRSLLPLVLPVLLLIPAVFLLIPLGAGLIITVVASQVPPVVRAIRSRTVVLGGRILVAAIAVALLPGAVVDLADVVARDAPVASATATPD